MRSWQSCRLGLGGKCRVMVTSTLFGEVLPFKEGVIQVQGRKTGSRRHSQSLPCPGGAGGLDHVASVPSTCLPWARHEGSLGWG